MAQLKRAFNKGDETTSEQSKQCTHEMLSQFAKDTEKGLQILQTYRLKNIDLQKQLMNEKNPEKIAKFKIERDYTANLCVDLEADLKTLPTKRSLVTNTMSRRGVLERFAHMESHNNMCKYMIREGNRVENDRFVNMTNASFEILADCLGDALAIMGSTALDTPNGLSINRDVAMHACPLLCVVPDSKTIEEIYNIIKRLHVPYGVSGSEMASMFDVTGSRGVTSVSSSSGYATHDQGETPNPGATHDTSQDSW